MSFRAILFTSLGLAAAGIIYLLRRNQRGYRADLGAVSDNWLAEHRVSPSE